MAISLLFVDYPTLLMILSSTLCGLAYPVDDTVMSMQPHNETLSALMASLETEVANSTQTESCAAQAIQMPCSELTRQVNQKGESVKALQEELQELQQHLLELQMALKRSQLANEVIAMSPACIFCPCCPCCASGLSLASCPA